MRKNEAAHPAVRTIRDAQRQTAEERAEKLIDGLRWEVDVLPIPATFGDDPAARPVIAVIAAGGRIVRLEAHAHPPAGAPAVAELLAQEIAAARETTNIVPVAIAVRSADLARELARLAAPIPVEVAPLVEIDAVIAAMEHDLFSVPAFHGPRSSRPETWAGWGLSAPLVERIFAASADYYRAAPWRVLLNDDVITITSPDGGTWHAVVMGNAEEMYGLALYHDRADIDRLLLGPDSVDEQLTGLTGMSIVLAFSSSDDIPRRMRREIRTARWPIAGPTAYPELMVLNTPGGGITEPQAADLANALEVIPRFLAAHAAAIEEAIESLSWVDPATHSIVRFQPMPIELPWDPPDTLAPCCAEGAGATPGHSLLMSEVQQALEREMAIVPVFERWLMAPGRGKPLKPATASKHVRIAQLLVASLVQLSGAPVSAISELDLRLFVYNVVPLRFAARVDAAILTSVRHFLDFLAVERDIQCPWAAAILADRDAFLDRAETCPTFESNDDELDLWVQELTIDLAARVLLPSDEAIARDGQGVPIIDDALIQRRRRWLVWRDEEIRRGITEPEAVRARLIARAQEA